MAPGGTLELVPESMCFDVQVRGEFASCCGVNLAFVCISWFVFRGLYFVVCISGFGFRGFVVWIFSVSCKGRRLKQRLCIAAVTS